LILLRINEISSILTSQRLPEGEPVPAAGWVENFGFGKPGRSYREMKFSENPYFAYMHI
jgi:hypothetical protein